MTKNTAIYDIIFIVCLAVICHLLFSSYGFNPTDEGFVLSTSNRLLHGQIPHIDFSSVRPVGYAFLHIPELLFSKNYVYLISRFEFWLEQVLIAFLWIRFLLVVTKNEIGTLSKYLLVIIVFILNVHYFPCYALHTVDGLFMCIIGLNIIISNKKYNYLGFLFIGFAALCKQNFILFLPFSILFYNKKNSVLNTIIGLLPIVMYVSIISILGGFDNLSTQLTTHHEIIAVGIISYIKSRLFFAGLLLFAFIFFINNKLVNLFSLFIIIAICCYALVTNRIHEKFSFLLFGITLGCLLITIIKKQNIYFKLFSTSLLLAWSVSISVGYNSPILFIGGNIALVIFYLVEENKIDTKQQKWILISIVIPLAMVFYHVRTNNIYRETPAKTLIYKLDNIVDGAYGIKTNRNTFKVLVELDLLKKSHPNLIVLPDFTACNILHSHHSKIRTEWCNKTEIPNDTILQFVIQDFVHDTTAIIATPKYNLATFNYGFEKLPPNKIDDFLILRYIYKHYRKIEDYIYFEIYRK